MSSATAPAAPPAITAAEKTAVLTAAFLVGVLLAIPFTRGLAVDAVVGTATFVVDTAANVARALGSLVGLA
jgi:hypothetical protein